MKRVAILMGSSLPIANITDKIDISIVRNSISGMSQVLSNLGDESFEIKKPLINKTFLNVMGTFDKIEDVDLLLFYYIGHGYQSEEDLYLNYKEFKIDRLTPNWTLAGIMNMVQAKNIRNIVIILDCCFSGQAIYALGSHNVNCYLMGAATGYAYYNDYVGVFTNNLVIALLQKTPPKDLIDRARNVITFKTWFEYVNQSIIRIQKGKQRPIEHGNGMIDLNRVKKKYRIGFNPFLSRKSLYTKLYWVLKKLYDKPLSKDELKRIILKDDDISDIFVGRSGPSKIVKDQTLNYYLNLLKKLDLTKKVKSKWMITKDGKQAIEPDKKTKENKFNILLIDSIYAYWKSHDIDHEDVRKIIINILVDYDVPNTYNILRFLSDKKNIYINQREFKDTLSLLVLCGVYKKASSDTYFPT